MNKYTLVIEGSEYFKKEIIFQTDDKKSTKVDIYTIDAFTTKFIDKQELINYIIEKTNDVKDISYIYIENPDTKENFEIAYSDKQDLSKLEIINNKINPDTKEFKKILFNFLKALEEEEFYKYIMKQIPIELKKNIVKRMKCGDYSNTCLYDISKSLENYKELRKLFFYANNYKLEKLEKQRKDIAKKYQKIIQPKF